MRKKVSEGREGTVVDFLVTRIAYFRLRVYDAIRAKAGETKRSPLRYIRACTRLARLGHKGDGGRRCGTRDACTRLQDEINTILCKRARLIARGKASGISGIPNKLTLNAEGSSSSTPPSFLYLPIRIPSANSREPPTFSDENDEEKYMYRCPPQHAVFQYHLTAISLIRSARRVRGWERKTIWKRVPRKLCMAPAQMTEGWFRDASHAALFLLAEWTQFHLRAFVADTTSFGASYFMRHYWMIFDAEYSVEINGK